MIQIVRITFLNIIYHYSALLSKSVYFIVSSELNRAAREKNKVSQFWPREKSENQGCSRKNSQFVNLESV